MITRIVKMTFAEESVGDFLANFQKNKEQIRNFPGCHKLILLRDHQNPNVFFTYSWWSQATDLENYRQSELFQGVWSFTKSLFSAKPEAWSTEALEVLEWLH